jgi:hypothetical protein
MLFDLQMETGGNVKVWMGLGPPGFSCEFLPEGDSQFSIHEPAFSRADKEWDASERFTL